MAKPNPNSHPKLPLNLGPLPPSNSILSQNQLIDSLTSHISLYHSLSSAPASSPPNPRSSVLKWFSSLSVHQRQAHLTIVDRKFTRILIQMLGKLSTQGHGFFIILPDLPSSSSSSSDLLPSLCFKKSHGLLSRHAESHEQERLIFGSTLLFNSEDGESANDPCSVNCLDSVTVSEGFVQNLDLFVETMDKVSNGEFLRGEESELGSNWVEFGWLKAKGHYSIEAFVANRLEVALRLSWLNSCSGKKRGVKLKEKVNMAGVAANVYWRKKGCIDWWVNLDAVVKRKVLTAFLGKSAKFLTHKILNGARNASEDEMWLFNVGGGQQLRYTNTVSSQKNILTLKADAEFGSTVTHLSGRPNSLANICNSISVLQNIITMILSCLHSDYDKEKLFFSTMASVSTVTDCILRTVRGFLMVISLGCTKLELLEEGKCKPLPNKSKEKASASSHKKRAKTRNKKKINPDLKSSADELSCNKPQKVLDCTPDHEGKSHLLESNKMHNMCQGEAINGKTSLSIVEMECSQRLVVGKAQSNARKSRKDRKKVKKPRPDVDVQNNARSASGASFSCAVSHEEQEAANSMTVCPSTHTGGNNNLTVMGTLVSDSSAIVPTREDSGTGRVQDNFVSGSSNASSNVIPPAIPGQELDSVSKKEDSNFQVSIPTSQVDEKSSIFDKSRKCFDITKDPTVIQKQTSENFIDNSRPTTSSEYLSYEWPNVASVYIPAVNSHLPAATDRLHLDVGSNWHNHFRQSYVSTLHQPRNAPIEARCNQILSRPLPMSLDWPPMVRSACRLVPSLTCNYEAGFISRRHSTFQQGFTAHGLQLNATISDNDKKYSGDFMDLPDIGSSQEPVDEGDTHWISEEEYEVHPVSGLDYNQYFGGGVMYWNPSDHLGAGYSRPPSLSSDDSSWAWREADMNRTVDDMVAFSSSYSTNGLTSPTAASFCSSFDALVPGHHALGYVVPGNEVSGKALHFSPTIPDAASEEEASGSLANLPGDEGKTGDSLPYPILRPIIVPNMSRERSRSRGHDHKSPCVPPTRREHPRVKRPPSPVVLCVPRAPRPPPPSPMSDSRKHRGFPTVRSGSSSPRHWGMRYHDASNFEEAYVCMDGTEVVWPSWRNKSLSTRPMIQPLPAALLQDRLIAISQLARDQEHPDVALPLQPPELENHPARKASLLLMHSLLHEEIDSFRKQVASENMARKPYVNWAVKRVTRSLQVLWPRSRTNIFGSSATGLSLPTSDVDLVVCLPPVRNLEPIKEAGILEGRNGIKETCLQHAARYLANQEWVKSDSVKTVENTAIPVIMLVVEVPHDLTISSASVVPSPKDKPVFVAGEQGNDSLSDVLEDSVSPKSSHINYDNTKNPKSLRLDISFKSPSHTGLQTTELVKELTEQFPAATPLALVLKQFLADRSLDQSYSGGLSSYCLVLLIIRFLQHEHHLGRPINQNFGSLLMDFLYFFGNLFDPRQMCISVRGSGVYINRERGYSIDPIHIDDPLFPTNNVGRNCFRIHQCIKAFSEAYSTLENELVHLPSNSDASLKPPNRLLPKIIPSIDLL